MAARVRISNRVRNDAMERKTSSGMLRRGDLVGAMLNVGRPSAREEENGNWVLIQD